MTVQTNDAAGDAPPSGIETQTKNVCDETNISTKSSVFNNSLPRFYRKLKYQLLCSLVPPRAKVSPNSIYFAKVGTDADQRGKWPGKLGSKGWHGYDPFKEPLTEADIDEQANNGACCGIVCGQQPDGKVLVAIDWDASRKEDADVGHQLIAKYIGRAAKRYGNDPKFAVLVKTDPGFAYQRVEFGPEKKAGHFDRVELLADRKMVVVDSIHPKTGKAYRWEPQAPHYDEAPFVSHEALTALLAEAAALLPEAQPIKDESVGSNDDEQVDQSRLRGDPKLVRQVMRAYPNCGPKLMHRDSWIEVLYACKASYGPEHEAEAVEDGIEFSSRWEFDGAVDENGYGAVANDPDFVVAEMRRMKPPYRRGFPWLLGEVEVATRNLPLDQRCGRWLPFLEREGETAEVAPPSSGTVEKLFPDTDAPDLTFLDGARRPAPRFPTEIFGFALDLAVTELAAGTSSPVDYVALPLLSVAGALLASTRWPKATVRWFEPPLLFAANVGDPSSSKSSALKAVLEALTPIERHMASGYDAALRLYQQKLQHAKALREHWDRVVKSSIKNGETPPDLPEGAIPPDEPVRPRIVIGDATTEAVAAIVAGLDRALLMARDELAGWFSSFDRYVQAAGADRSFWLECYGGGSLVKDRAKSPIPIRMDRLAVGVVGGVQPARLKPLLESADDGLVSRILWSWPDKLPKFRLARELGDNTYLTHIFARLAALKPDLHESGNPAPRPVNLTPDAVDALEAHGQHMEVRAAEAPTMLAGAIGKHRGHVLRLSCIFEHLWWACSDGPEPGSISAEAVSAAVALVEGYFLPMATRVLGDAAIPLVEQHAVIIARHLRKHGLATFNARTLSRELGGALRETGVMDKACAYLVDTGAITEAFGRAGERVGRMSKTYRVHPALLAKPTVH